MPRFFFSLFLTILCFCQNALFANEQDLLQIQKNWNKISHFEAHFEQYTNSFSEEEIFASGNIQYQKPTFIRWQYQKPEPQLVIVGEEKVWVYDALLDTVNIKPKEEIISNTIFFYLSQKNGLSKHFQVLSKIACSQKLKKKKPFLEVCLKPKTKKLPIQELHLGISKNYQIISFFIADSLGETEFYLQNFQFHSKIKKESFEFIPKKGTQIIQ